MIKDMYSVMQRISDIEKRFGLKRHNNEAAVQEEPGKQEYSKIHSNALDESVKSEEEINMSGTSREDINRIAEFYAKENEISPDLVKAVIKNESGYNPRAVSPKGAKGLMQLMPSVISDTGVKNPFSPGENIKAGVSLLKDLLENYDWDYKKALAAYNAGRATVDRNNGVPDYKETRNYIDKVIGSYLDIKE